MRPILRRKGEGLNRDPIAIIAIAMKCEQ